MKRHAYRIAYAFIEFVTLSILAVLPAALVYLDVVAVGHGVGEISATEVTQGLLLLTTILIFYYGAWRYAKCRGFCMLVAGFFTCALIRELDGYLDAIWQGFWFWPAITLALATIAYVGVCCRESVVAPMSSFIGTRPYFYILMGLIVLLVFSRVFGSGNLLWKDVLDLAYTVKFKEALQEGLELFGYLFIACGSCIFMYKSMDSSAERVQG